jgi:hypothetical protein
MDTFKSTAVWQAFVGICALCFYYSWSLVGASLSALACVPLRTDGGIMWCMCEYIFSLGMIRQVQLCRRGSECDVM